MSEIANAQGSTINWRGGALGNLVRFKVVAPPGQSTDVTLMSAPRVGSGGNVRVARQTSTLILEPVEVEVEFLGVPVLQTNDRGLDGAFVLNFPSHDTRCVSQSR